MSESEGLKMRSAWQRGGLARAGLQRYKYLLNPVGLPFPTSFHGFSFQTPSPFSLLPEKNV